MGRTKYTREVLIELFKENGLTWVDGKSKYKSVNETIYCLDKEGYECLVRISDLKRNHGTRPFYNSNPYTISNIKLWISKNRDDIEIVDGQKYVLAKTKMEFKCLKCGEIFKSDWDSISHGKGCSYCNGNSVSKNNCFATNAPDKIKFFKDKELPYKIRYKTGAYAIFKCPECGFEKEMRISDFRRRGFSCNNCNPDYGVTRNNEIYSVLQAERNKDLWINKKTYLYVVKMFKENESFYKIGIGYNGAGKRFSDRVNTSYYFDILFEHEMTLYDGIIVEHELHNYFNEFSYIPKIKFKGYTECFSKINLDFIKDFINKYQKE